VERLQSPRIPQLSTHHAEGVTAAGCQSRWSKITPTPAGWTGLSSVKCIRKYTSCWSSAKKSPFFGYNITIERSGRTGEAERVRWVYEWGGGGSDSRAKDATVSFIARTAHHQTTPPPHHEGVLSHPQCDIFTMHSGCWDFWSPRSPNGAIDCRRPSLRCPGVRCTFGGSLAAYVPVRCLGACWGGGVVYVRIIPRFPPPAGKNYKLRKEFHDCTAQCCDMIPWRLILPVCPHLSRGVGSEPARISSRVHACSAYSLVTLYLGSSSSDGVCGLLVVGYHSYPDTRG
jgi:hypothetical protein